MSGLVRTYRPVITVGRGDIRIDVDLPDASLVQPGDLIVLEIEEPHSHPTLFMAKVEIQGRAMERAQIR